MSNVLDLVDQTAFVGERATGATNLLQCRLGVQPRRSTSTVCAGSITTSSRGGYRAASNAHRCRSAAIAGSRRVINPSWKIAATPRPREEFDAWLERAGRHPPGCRARTRMAPRGAAVHRRRRRGELRYLPLPHRRRRALRGVGGRGFRPPRPDQLACRRITPALASAARGRPPNRARHPRYRPRRRRGGAIRPT